MTILIRQFIEQAGIVGVSGLRELVKQPVDEFLSCGGAHDGDRQAWRRAVLDALVDVSGVVWHWRQQQRKKDWRPPDITEWLRSFTALVLMRLYATGDEKAFGTLWVMLEKPRRAMRCEWQQKGDDADELEQHVAERLLKENSTYADRWLAIVQMTNERGPKDGVLPRLDRWFIAFARSRAIDWHRAQPDKRRTRGGAPLERWVEYIEPDVLAQLAEAMNDGQFDTLLLHEYLEAMRPMMKILSEDEQHAVIDHYLLDRPVTAKTRSAVAKLRYRFGNMRRK